MRTWGKLGVFAVGGALVSLVIAMPAQAGVGSQVSTDRPTFGPLHSAAIADDQSPWAGYVDTGGIGYTTVSADWTEPEATCSPSENSAASFWVGLDGGIQGNNTVEQVGTTVGCVDGTPVHNAFVEFFPDPPIPIIGPIGVNDSFTGTSTWVGSDVYSETITDNTAGWTKTITGTRTGATNSTAEVIAEAPTVGKQFPLTNFGVVQFTNCTVNGNPISQDPDVLQPSVVGASGLVDAIATPLSDGTDFAVVWENSD